MLKLLIFLVFVIGCSAFLTQAFSLDVELQKEDERINEALGFLTELKKLNINLCKMFLKM